MIKKSLLFFCLILFSIKVTSQVTYSKSIHLSWSNSKVFAINKDITVKTPIIKNGSIDTNLLPYYTTSWLIPPNSKLKTFHVSNIKYAFINKSETLNLPMQNIKTSLNNAIKLIVSGKRIYLKMIPLLKENSSLKKITSFDLNYELTPLSSVVSKTSSVINSVLANGIWYKFAIDSSGVYKIDKKFLQNLGINTSAINPKNIRIYGNGGAMLPQLNSAFRYADLQEDAIYVHGENDGSFDNNDYILFYAKGPNGWNIDTVNKKVSHIKNIYTDQTTYFLTVDQGPGKRITSKPTINQNSIQTITTFNDYLFYEKDWVNLFAIGRQWFGEDFSINNNRSFVFNFDNIDTTQPISIKVRAVAASSSPSVMNVSVNKINAFNLNFSAISSTQLSKASARIATNQVTINSSQLSVNLDYNNNGNPSSKAFLDYIEILGVKKLIATGKQFSFRNFDVANNDNFNTYKYLIKNANNIDFIWDITDFINPKSIQNESNDGTFTFKSFGGTANKGTLNEKTTLSQYIVVSKDDYYIPKQLKNKIVQNQNIHQLQNIDYLIVTNNELKDEAQRLADYHKDNDGFTTAVVTTNQIYNEFSSGNLDPTAIRDFVKYLYDNTTNPIHKIKYVCLFGDTSYDYKNKIRNNNNIVPSIESYESFNLASSYVTDDYYGMMDANEGKLTIADKQDVATGRFPVTTLNEAKTTVDKTLDYYNNKSFGSWRNKITLVADDPDKASEFVLEKSVEEIADTITARKPIFNLQKIYADAYKQETSSGGQRYPDVNKAITNSVENGTLIIDYFGHGGEDGWAKERILTVPEIKSWKNTNKSPLFITVTCEFSRLDNPLRPTAGEFVFLNEKGGSINMITTTREIFIFIGENFNADLTKKLLNFKNKNYSIAEDLMHMKNDIVPSSSQRLFVFYFGDPAMHLAIPRPNIKLTKMNGKLLASSIDTLKALSHVTFEGEITDKNNVLLSNFNGTLATLIYDKPLLKKTLDNDNFGKTLEFDAIESKIYTGRTTVKNGRFNFEFIVPKDIRIAYGKSKFSFYAKNTLIDKAGYTKEIPIGGIDTNAPQDIKGPTIQLFMNDESFIDGGNTNQSPLFIANLSDISGINTSLTSVDHDLIAILDGDTANPILLNDYYQTELDDFKNGKVKFQFRNLSVGPHTIKFKAWDTYNNYSEATLNFVVVSDSKIVLSHVLNYPNPFVNYTEFWFTHNKPNEPLNVQIQIFTISGKLVKTIQQTVQTSGSLSRSIIWNGLDDFGEKIGKGVYIYKLTVSTIQNNQKTEKIEKLVIL